MAHILVIDDDAFFQEFLCRLLGAEGHDVVRAGSVTEADSRVQAAEFDLVFLDVRLPDGSGLDLLPRLRALPSEPEVVIITGAGDPDGAELAILSGAWDYIEKSASLEALRLACLRALRFREKKQDALTLRRQLIVPDTFQTFEVWFTVAGVYLVLTLALSLAAGRLERRLQAGA